MADLLLGQQVRYVNAAGDEWVAQIAKLVPLDSANLRVLNPVSGTASARLNVLRDEVTHAPGTFYAYYEV